MLGQLMRAEGWINVVVGHSQSDYASSYVQKGVVGPLFRGYTGVDLRLEEIAYGYSVDNVDRGRVPLLVISREGREISRTRVYPNSPATYGPLTIHRDEFGPALVAAVTPSGSTEATFTTAYFAPNDGTQTPEPVVIRIAYGTSKPYSVQFAPQADKRVVVTILGTDFASKPLSEGESATLPDGTTIVLSELTTYARLFVVNDWTVPFVYIAFVLIAVLPLWALLLPPRLVFAALSEDGRTLNVRVVQAKSDPAFGSRVRTAFDTSFSIPPESEEPTQ